MTGRFPLIVCGGRDFGNAQSVYRVLDQLRKEKGVLTLIQGGARGADMFAREWAFAQDSVHLVNVPANWQTHGPAAGPIRNQEMIDDFRPELVVAFPGGRGTRDMVLRAKRAGIPVMMVPD